MSYKGKKNKKNIERLKTFLKKNNIKPKENGRSKNNNG